MILLLTLIMTILALVPAIVFARNWTLYASPKRASSVSTPAVISVLIPARNEELGIANAVSAAMASRGVQIEVIVLDDHSTDQTCDIVQALADLDSRVRLEHAPPLPEGWCGKQHACHHLSTLASHELLAFIDADVRLAPDGLSLAAEFLRSAKADLVSGIPRQQTDTFLEKLLIPLIHFVLLGYLPIDRMRASGNPAYGAGCGQFFLARRSAYVMAGGHAPICQSMHDGIQLPRSFRRAGLRTDLFDATEAATCRMYRSAGQVWRGLEKNATEGMASPGAIVPWTIILIGGQVLPIVLLATLAHSALPLVLCTIATGSGIVMRLAAGVRFRQSMLGAILHPVGVLILLAVQWSALLRKIAGRPAQWKGRGYPVNVLPSPNPRMGESARRPEQMFSGPAGWRGTLPTSTIIKSHDIVVPKELP